MAQLPVVSTAEEIPTNSAFILTSEAMSATASQHIFVDPDSTHVHLQSADYPFEKENESFKDFKNRYAVFWTLFNTLLILSVL